jgi:uncharacterized membrane protein YdjX (TVP38/TMEM64 family)
MNKNIIKKFLPLSIILIMIVCAWYLGLQDYVNLDTIKSQRSELLNIVSDRPYISILAFVSMYIISVALSLPIATVLTLLGGFLFGRWLGTFLIVISATMGASILFLAAKSAIGTTLRQKAGPLYKKIESNMNQNAIGYLLFMRLVPIFPFFLVNIVPALFNIRLTPYLATTFFGIIPGTFVYANVGRELGTIESLSDLISTETLIAFTLLGLFALLPVIIKQVNLYKSN